MGGDCDMPTLELVTAEFMDSASFRIETEVTVMAPIGACWELIADQASWLQWFDNMSSVDATPWLWTEPGQTRVVKVNGLKVHEEAISLIPEQEFAFAIRKWPLPVAKKAAEGIRLEDRTNGGSPRTTLTYIGAFEPTFVGKLAQKILTKQLTAAWGPALKNLGELAAANASE